jgi:hypothetical protein
VPLASRSLFGSDHCRRIPFWRSVEKGARRVGVRAPIISCAIAVVLRKTGGSTTYRTREDQMFGLDGTRHEKGVTIKNGQWKQKEQNRTGGEENKVQGGKRSRVSLT